jgi:hypothetical protein
MDSKHNKCVPFVGYGVGLKVWIEMFNCILSTIELVVKTLKTYDK